MNQTIPFATIVSLAMMLGAGAAQAQAPEQQRQMEYERQQREYWRAQEQQRQEQQRQQQIWNENARRQQEESARAATQRALPSASPELTPTPGGGGRAAPAPSQAAQLDKMRQDWLKRPALAPDRNPLLGTWTQPALAAARSADPFAQLGAMLGGGLCGVLFSSDGLFEFKPAALVGIDKRTRRVEPLDSVEYRGDARRVAVIPKSTLKLMVFDFDGPDRIQWVGQNCTLVRVAAPAALRR